MVFKPTYTEEQRRSAVAEVIHRRARDHRDRSVFREVAKKHNVGEQSLRIWTKEALSENISEAAAGPAPTTAESEDQTGRDYAIRVLREQVERLKEENTTLRRAFVLMSEDWTNSDSRAPRQHP